MFWVDELQMILQARKILTGAVAWVDYDPLSSGPINSLFLLLPKLFFLNIDIFSARALLMVTYVAQIIFANLICKKLFPQIPNRILVLPLIALFASLKFVAFSSYNSGALAGVIISFLIYLFVILNNNSKLWTSALIGGLVSILFFCKIQLLLTCVFFTIFFISRSNKLKSRLSHIFMYFFSVIIVAMFVMLPTIITGGFRDFYKSYLFASTLYNSSFISFTGPSGPTGISFVSSLMSGWEPVFVAFLICGLLIISILFFSEIFLYKKKIEKNLCTPEMLVLIFGIFLVQQIEFLIPRTGFPHYLSQMFFGIWLVLISVMALFLTNIKKWQKNALILIWTFFTIFPRWYSQGWGSPWQILSSYSQLDSDRDREWYEVFLSRKLPERSTVSIWGYLPQLYYYLDKLPATRDAMPMYAIARHEYQDYFQRRYVEDLKKSKPDYIFDTADSGGFILNDWKKFGYQTNPYLLEYIDSDYKLINTFKSEGAERGVLLFQRKDSQYTM